MIEVSENLRNLINEDSRTFRVKLVKGTDTYDEIISFKKSVLFPNSSMSIGNALSACIECTATDVPVSITGAEVEAQITILDSEEWISLGKFTVEKPTVQDGNVSFLAYDKMTAASNKTYTSTLAEGEHTAQEYFSDICSVLGAECVALSEEIGGLLIAEDKLSGYSCRDALAYLAGFIGRNCIVNGNGLFEMIGFTAVDYDMLNADRIAEPELSDTDSIIGYIACCVDNETTLQSGTGSNGFELISPIMTQERLDSIGVDIFGDESVIKVYKPGKIKQLLGDPTFEICDVVSLDFNGNVYTVPIMSLVLNYDGGLQAEIESFELTEPSSLTLGERLSFQQKQAKKDTEQFIKNFNEKLKTGLEQGSYRKVITNADGSETTYYFNTPEIENATYIFYFGATGMAWAKGSGCWNGGNPTWQYGTNAEGDAILENLLLRTLVADLIQAGTLQSTNGKTAFNLDEGIFRSESDVSDNRKLIMEQTAGEQTFEIQDGEGNTVATGGFSARGLTIEQNQLITDKDWDTFLAEKKAEWEEANAPTTWEEYASAALTSIAANMKIIEWKLLHMINNAQAKIILKSTVEGYEGTTIITPTGITIDGNSVLTDKVTPAELGITPAAIGAAPSGYGLGETNGKVVTDCNAAVLPGFYVCSGETCLNYPTDWAYFRYGALFVQRRYTTVYQTITYQNSTAKRYGTTADGGKTWTFNEWEYDNPPLTAGVEYRTTERYASNPVYVKLINFGKMPNNTAASISLGTNYNIVSIDGKAYKDNYTVPITVINNINSIYYNKSDGKLYVETNTDASQWTAALVVKYTK